MTTALQRCSIHFYSLSLFHAREYQQALHLILFFFPRLESFTIIIDEKRRREARKEGENIIPWKKRGNPCDVIILPRRMRKCESFRVPTERQSGSKKTVPGSTSTMGRCRAEGGFRVGPPNGSATRPPSGRRGFSEIKIRTIIFKYITYFPPMIRYVRYETIF